MADVKPESMAAIGTHEEAIALARRYFPAGGRVADLAAGQGAFSEMLDAQGFSVIAVDLNAADWKSNKIAFRTEDLDSEFAERLIEKEGKFDGIAAVEIVEHIENPFQFIRECGKLLQPGGHLLVTTPNVDSVYSRLMLLYTGRLYGFSEFETVRPAHITPIFRWKLKMMFDEAGFEIVDEIFVPLKHLPDASIKAKATQTAARLLQRFVKGDKGAEGRIVVGRLK